MSRTTDVSAHFAPKDETSTYQYQASYHPRPIEQQVTLLRHSWPRLRIGRGASRLAELPLPIGAEAFFAVVRWQALATKYTDALENEIFPAIKEVRDGRFSHYWSGELTDEGLRTLSTTREAFESLYRQQESDILIIPAQFGKRHVGSSVQRARALFSQNEFGLDSAAIGSMLLTHPERLSEAGDINVDVCGDDYAGRGRFDLSPCFGFDEGGLGFTMLRRDISGGAFGSASAFDVSATLAV